MNARNAMITIMIAAVVIITVIIHIQNKGCTSSSSFNRSFTIIIPMSATMKVLQRDTIIMLLLQSSIFIQCGPFDLSLAIGVMGVVCFTSSIVSFSNHRISLDRDRVCHVICFRLATKVNKSSVETHWLGLGLT